MLCTDGESLFLPAVVWACGPGEPAAGRSGGPWSRSRPLLGDSGCTDGTWGADTGPVPGLPAPSPSNPHPSSPTNPQCESRGFLQGILSPTVLWGPVSSQTLTASARVSSRSRNSEVCENRCQWADEPTWEVPGLGAPTDPLAETGQREPHSFLSGSPCEGRKSWFGCFRALCSLSPSPVVHLLPTQQRLSAARARAGRRKDSQEDEAPRPRDTALCPTPALVRLLQERRREASSPTGSLRPRSELTVTLEHGQLRVREGRASKRRTTKTEFVRCHSPLRWSQRE